VKQIRERFTYANVMSTIAVFLVLGGATAFAASQLGKNSVGKKQLKANAVTTAKIKKNAVTAAKIKANAVTTAKIKNGAITGEKIAAATIGATQLGAGSVGNAQTQVVKVFKAGAVPVVGTEATSPKIPLGSVGPFNFYGKCFVSGVEVESRTYIEITSGVATLGSEDAAEFENNGDGYLTPITPESERALEEDASAKINEFSANSDDEEFQASASDGTEITGEAAGTGAKQGNPPAGQGPFLAGDSCIIGTIAIFGN
jgi:hypothetical protein